MLKYTLNEKRKNTEDQKRSKQQLTSPRSSKNSELLSPKNSRNNQQQSNNLPLIKKPIPSALQSPQLKIQMHSEQKILIFVIKRLIHNKILIKTFNSIKITVKSHKISLFLLFQKPKRLLNDAFMPLKLNFIQQKHSNIFPKLQSLKFARILPVILLKHQRKLLEASFEKIRIKSLQKVQFYCFIQNIDYIIQKSIQKEFKTAALQRLRLNTIFNELKRKYLQKMASIYRKAAMRYLSLCFAKIINFTVVKGYEWAIQQRKQRNQIILSVFSQKKSIINEQKQRLKKLKLLFDSWNLEKNRLMNELKKSRANIKLHMRIDIQQLQRKELELEEILRRNQSIFQQQKKELAMQKIKKFEAQQGKYVMKLITIYKDIESFEKVEIKIPQLNAFKQMIEEGRIKQFTGSSVEYYYHQNHQLLALIRAYEQTKNQDDSQPQSEYLNVKNENQKLYNLLSLLIERLIHNKNYDFIASNEKKLLNEQSSPRSDNFHCKLSSQSEGSQKYKSVNSSGQQLPISSKKSSSTSSLTRTTGKICSRATYSNF